MSSDKQRSQDQAVTISATKDGDWSVDVGKGPTSIDPLAAQAVIPVADLFLSARKSGDVALMASVNLLLAHVTKDSTPKDQAPPAEAWPPPKAPRPARPFPSLRPVPPPVVPAWMALADAVPRWPRERLEAWLAAVSSELEQHPPERRYPAKALTWAARTGPVRGWVVVRNFDAPWVLRCDAAPTLELRSGLASGFGLELRDGRQVIAQGLASVADVLGARQGGAQ